MKMIRNIALLILLLFPLMGSAQCSANISYQTNCLTVQFAGLVQPNPTPNTSFYWWFSDGNNSSTLLNPSYTFSGPGTYMVCFSFYDPANGCSDSTCVPVTVVQCGCTADFTSLDTAGSTYFMSSTTASNPTYYWDFGDGNFSTAAYPWHQYANPGTYTVCLTVYDSMQFCDSTCHTVVVPNSGGCTATFSSIDSLGYVFFVSSTTAGAGAMYYWDFGDGNYSSSQNPSHVYANPGTYTVCLTVYDSMQNFCDSVCYQIQATTVGVEETNYLQSSLGAAPNPADASLTLSFMTLNSGNATIKFFDASGRMAGTETVAVHGAGYNKTEINTTNMAQGIYLVKIEVDGTEAWTRIAVTHQ